MPPNYQNALLHLRSNRILQRICLSYLANRNITHDEIVEYDFVNKRPRITLKNGIRLNAFDDLDIGEIRTLHTPASHTGCVASYLLRHRFGHAFPEAVIDTRPVSRMMFPAVLHRQHLNTLHDLSEDSRMEFLEEIPVRHGDFVLEIGPYIGFGTVRLANVVGAAGRVISIEADSRAHEILMENVSQNNLSNVETLRFAVGGYDEDHAPFYRSGRQANSLEYAIVASNDFEPISVKSLATVLDTIGFIPTFMILTINGSELNALRSAQDQLQEAENMRIVVPGWYRDTEGRLGGRIVALLESLGFRVARTRGMHIFAYKPT